MIEEERITKQYVIIYCSLRKAPKNISAIVYIDMLHVPPMGKLYILN
jgi:hypothetical protein